MNIELRRKTRLLTANKVCREDIMIEPVLQEKTVTEKGVYVPDNGYVGFSKVNVDASGNDGTIEGILGDPHMPKFGRLKYIATSPSRILYKDVGVFTTTYPSLGFNYHSISMACYSFQEATASMFQPPINQYDGDATETYTDNDGNVYTLYNHTDIIAEWRKISQNSVNVTEAYIPKCSCKVYLLDNNNNIITSEYEIPETVMEAQSKTCSESGTYCVARRMIQIGCNYGGNSIVGVEFIYPKHTATFKCSLQGVEYTFDGKTFKPLTDGLTLKDVEHIGIRNTRTSAIKIGTTDGASDINVINAGGLGWHFGELDEILYVS